MLQKCPRHYGDKDRKGASNKTGILQDVLGLLGSTAETKSFYLEAEQPGPLWPWDKGKGGAGRGRCVAGPKCPRVSPLQQANHILLSLTSEWWQQQAQLSRTWSRQNSWWGYGCFGALSHLLLWASGWGPAKQYLHQAKAWPGQDQLLHH